MDLTPLISVAWAFFWLLLRQKLERLRLLPMYVQFVNSRKRPKAMNPPCSTVHIDAFWKYLDHGTKDWV